MVNIKSIYIHIYIYHPKFLVKKPSIFSSNLWPPTSMTRRAFTSLPWFSSPASWGSPRRGHRGPRRKKKMWPWGMDGLKGEFCSWEILENHIKIAMKWWIYDGFMMDLWMDLWWIYGCPSPKTVDPWWSRRTHAAVRNEKIPRLQTEALQGCSRSLMSGVIIGLWCLFVVDWKFHL